VNIGYEESLPDADNWPRPLWVTLFVPMVRCCTWI